MALLCCPECNEEVSEYAEVCPKCGFPINKFKKDNNLDNTNNLWICPKCGAYSIPNRNIKCGYCKHTMIETNYNINEGFIKFDKIRRVYQNENPDKDFFEELAKEYGKDIFSKELYDEREEKRSARIRAEYQKREQARQSTQSTQPTSSQVACPYCKSTNTKKISTTGRVASVLSFGLLSKKVGKQWYCNDCKSYF